MTYKAYIYPITNRLKTGVYNPYMDNFMASTEPFITFLNKHHPSDSGIFNLVRFIFKADLLILNWVENLPDKKMGTIQTLFFLFVLQFRKLFGVKVVWTLHNKFSHSSEGMGLKRMLFKKLLRNSDHIITHATEGMRFAESLQPGISAKIFYFPHPVVPFKRIEPQPTLQHDILIWGTLSPYKGVDAFLEYLETNNALDRFRILIAGKAVSPAFFEKIHHFERENISIRNQFIETDDLARMIAASKVVLFTYAGGSVLSSGALIDSIAHGAFVIGPAVGAFADMEQVGLVKTYKDFDELLPILDTLSHHTGLYKTEALNTFIREHRWEKFAQAFKASVLTS